MNIYKSTGIVFSAAALAQQYPAPFPREGSKKADESQCFIIWNVVYENSKPTGLRKAPLDQVTVFWREGPVKFSRPDGTWSVEQEKVSSIRFKWIEIRRS